MEGACETGAMIAGALASLTLVMLFVPRASSLIAARAAAMMTVAIGIGGSMTYGQTVGLTHDSEVIGDWEALRWGLLGLFVKGAIWIGFAGSRKTRIINRASHDADQVVFFCRGDELNQSFF